jgi:hypothetical protein
MAAHDWVAYTQVPLEHRVPSSSGLSSAPAQGEGRARIQHEKPEVTVCTFCTRTLPGPRPRDGPGLPERISHPR